MIQDSKVKHTRGPWRAATEKGNVPQTLYYGIVALLMSSGEPDGYVAVVTGNGDRADEWCPERDIHAKQVANARLIAAAPDLLAELEGVVAHYRLLLPYLREIADDQERYRPLAINMERDLVSVERAIAKATGTGAPS